MRHREVKKLAHSNTTRKWQKQVTKAGRMVSEFRLLTNKENKTRGEMIDKRSPSSPFAVFLPLTSIRPFPARPDPESGCGSTGI